jgi:release factor glutamine methyltransferase
MSGEGDTPWTVVRLLAWTKDYLARAGVEDARLTAEVLLAAALECPRIELYARYDYRPGPDQLARYRRMVSRAAAHEPAAYLVGRKEFYALPFKVTPDVLIPRPETEVLVEQAIAHLRAVGGEPQAWDVCTGCGCVAVALADQVDRLRVLATDASPEAVAVARQNAEANGVHERVRVQVADLLTPPDNWPHPTQFDAITANPPYVADGDWVAEPVRHEPPAALRAGPEGLDVIRPLVRDAPGFLRPGGALILEFGAGQADAVRDLVVAAGAYREPRIVPDHRRIDRVCVAVRRDDGGAPP